jgi:hypothetical protein
MIRVCPNARIWVDIYQRLEESWRRGGCRCEAPPIPLVLAGWIYSSDRDKQQRWDQTITWAKENDFSHLVPFLRDEEYYATEVLSTSYPEQHYRPDRYAVRERPSVEALAEALHRLKRDWHSIIGSELAGCCQPQSFSGRKARRLVIWVSGEDTPPWGSWLTLSSGPERETFTALRKRINDAISPVHVDHIEFEVRVNG